MKPRLAVLAIAIAVGAASAPARGQSGGQVIDAGTSEALSLVEARGDAGYAGRASITRALMAMDDRAVAALVIAKRSKSATTRAWAADTLEAMGRERADEQIRTRSDDVLVGIFRAYGLVHDPDALGVLFSFVGSQRPAAREAARAALLAYGEDARTTFRQAYAELAGLQAPADWDAERTARELFAASDRVRLRDVYALLDEGLARAAGGDLAAAVADFDAVLARHAEIGTRPEVASAYVAYAFSIEDRDPIGARLYLEKAARLDPSSHEEEIAGELALLEGRELESRGLSDEEPYRRALRLDPASSRARAALDRLEAQHHARQARLRRWTEAGIAALAILIACILFVGRRAKRRRARRHAGT